MNKRHLWKWHNTFLAILAKPASSYQVYGREWLQSYRDFLKTFLLSAGNANVLGAKTYAGGISLSDMAANDANLDNNLVPTTDANTLLGIDNGYLRF